MKVTGKAFRIAAVFCLFCFILQGWGVPEELQRRLNVCSVAFAADEEDLDNGYLNDEYLDEEPFGEDEFATVSDPLEPLNRAFFQFNDKLYFWVLKPTSRVYAHFIPEGVRITVRNAFYNVLAPVRIVNTLLQGKLNETGVEFARFTINSTLGVGGMFDMAKTHFNLETHDEDLGQTLGVYGLGPGFYINLPFFGPSSLRDATGLVGDGFLDPLFWVTPNWFTYSGVYVGKAVNNTSLRLGEYEDFKESALDPYVAMRNGYIQHRRSVVKK